MAASGSYDKHASHRDVDAEIERLAAQARHGWEKEARTLSWLGLRDGMSLLELGSGPGFITAQLLELLPTSTVTCLEIDPDLLARAERYLQDKGSQRVRFVAGSVMESGLEADQFDFAYARLLFQHLADPVGAAKEILRVLKPGGRLVVTDIDDGLFGLFEPPIDGLSTVVERFGQAQAARGGNRHIGRSLWGILEDAGFRSLDLEVVVNHSGSTGVEPFMRQLDPDRLLPLVRENLLSAEDLERFRASRTAFLAAPKPFALWVSLMICAEKPMET
jgi:ubiquinone/menaquinone biosynthesis C-methylase UbiE